MSAIARPESGEYAPYYTDYIAFVPGADLLKYFSAPTETSDVVVSGLSEEKLLYRYADGKWSVKEVIAHIIDTERIFAYRALRIARGDTTPLPGFDEKMYAEGSFADERPIDDLIADYTAVRKATIALFRSFDASVYERMGTANTYNLSVRAAGYVIAGHELHHLSIIKERYLS